MKSIPVDDIFSDPDNLEFEKLDCYEYDKEQVLPRSSCYHEGIIPSGLCGFHNPQWQIDVRLSSYWRKINKVRRNEEALNDYMARGKLGNIITYPPPKQGVCYA